MRQLIPFFVLFVATAQAQDLETAKVLGAETRGTENVVAVQIGELAVVASYTAQFSVLGNTAEWRRASNLVVGSDVQARIDGSKLHVVMPNGKTVKADIVRRQLVTADAPFVLPETASPSQSSSDAQRRAQQEMEERQRCFQRQQMQHGLGGPVPNAAAC